MTVAATLPTMQLMLDRFRAWSRRVDLERKLALALVIAAVASGVATLLYATGHTDFRPNPVVVVLLLVLDGVLLLLLGLMVVLHLVKVWAERRRGLAGSGLHMRLVLLFGLVAVTPAILVAVFSALFLNFGIQYWFSERVRTAIEASNAVAHAYLEEHRQSIRADAFAMANDINREAPVLMLDPTVFSQRLSAQASLRSLSEAVVVDGSGRVMARSPFSFTLGFDLVPLRAIEQAAQGEIVILTGEREDRVRAVVRLNRFVDAYLVVGRFIHPEVLEHLTQTEWAVAQYQQLEERRGGILVTFMMIFVVVAVLLLLAAVWIGLTLATQISRPVSALVAAAERVRRGDLSVRVNPSTSVDEVGMLGRAFNRMTNQLQSQREGLILANRDLDQRRRFTETVLSGVSAGVIGLDSNALINLPNRSASELLDCDLEQAVGMPLVEVVPEMAALLADATARPDRQFEAEVRLMRDGRPRTLMVRTVAERLDEDVIGYVVTFDDVTALVSAQRTAAWADVARRIAHEIKNPLTPIQLASERLKRKYLKEIKSDPETFAACTDTIVRQVEDIGRMVDEFSSFARMPRPDLKTENLSGLVQEAVFLERNRVADIDFQVILPAEPVSLRCDSRQISQAMTNVLKNAAEAIAGRVAEGEGGVPPGRIGVELRQEDDDGGLKRIRIVIEDNGKGLPDEDRDRLTEPYVTTRSKGTGLGLAIVKKIMEDHNGDLVLEDREGGGARISLVFYSTVEVADTGRTPVEGERGRARDYSRERVTDMRTHG
ncbi:MAG: ATP-binding protein [Rhodospirillales bacterium]